jgi:hypothetical protein
MKTLVILIASLMGSSLVASDASADMGSVYVIEEGVRVSEDAQKAVILHNMQEEVLILGTELTANQITPIIRFIPFPSEPNVQLAPEGVFKRISAIVTKYGLQYLGGRALSLHQSRHPDYLRTPPPAFRKYRL